MSVIRIELVVDNTEIIYKLLKTTARKWDCDVQFNPETGDITFDGPEDMKKAITEDVLSMFSLCG